MRRRGCSLCVLSNGKPRKLLVLLKATVSEPWMVVPVEAGMDSVREELGWGPGCEGPCRRDRAKIRGVF